MRGRYSKPGCEPAAGLSAIAAALLLSIAAALLLSPSSAVAARAGRGPAAQPAAAASLTVDTRHVGRRIPSQFLGLGVEYQTLPHYTGTDSKSVDPVLEQLIRNLNPGSSPVLRIGGDTTDWSWWPVPGMRPPPGVSYSITPQWTAVTRSLASSLRARLILGINFQADSKRVAQVEAIMLIRTLGRGSIQALELGNEPELYHAFGFYTDAGGNPVAKRPTNWDFPLFEREFSAIGSSLPAAPLAGPATANPYWDAHFGRLLSDDHRLRLATIHRYPLLICSKRSSPRFPDVDHLLSRLASNGMAASIAGLVRTAHAHKLQLRLDEMNFTPCPHQASVLRRSVATALWSADVLFEMASVGVDGVNVQTTTGGTDDLFTFTQTSHRWLAAVDPEYYGLLMFARAAPVGSRLVRISRVPGKLRAWATEAPDRSLRVLVINEGTMRTSVALNGLSVGTSATLERLLVSNTPAGRMVTLGGQTFGTVTATGRFRGAERIISIRPSGSVYLITLPGRSAALLTVR